MANGLDRLERFFSKRKGSAASTQSVEPPVVKEQQFPSPSFIRPKATRMSAREELIVKQPGLRSHSLVDGLSPQRSISFRAQSTAPSPDSYRLQNSPIRVSSLRHRDNQPSFDGFYDFKFPRPPTNASEGSIRSSASTNSLEYVSNPSPLSRSRRQSHVEPERSDTPPSSDIEDDDHQSHLYFQNKKLPRLPPAALPTPSPSPDLSPTLDFELLNSTSVDALKQAVYEGFRRQRQRTETQDGFTRPESQSSLESSADDASVSSSTLREPDLNDFLDLTDEDIAEANADTRLSPESNYPSVPSMLGPAIASPQQKSLLTLTPPYASRPAAAAAFEAARIANRYNFDLVYVVNLWPDVSVLSTAGPEEDAVSISSEFSTKSSKGLTGRLLAAYGLHNVKSPFQISAHVHSKILRTQGWIEYRNQEARTDEFARGFACSFYTGQHSRTSSIASDASSPPARMRQSDRGIVFAAYRKPRADGSMAGVGSNKAELAAVHRDAEALVEMLIDIHVANRQRQPLSHSQHSEETGPMPLQRRNLH